MQGFSLHAAARLCADERQSLEEVGRCITRLALAKAGVQRSAAGRSR